MPGHTGIEYNGRADKAVKEGSRMVNGIQKIEIKYEMCVKMAKEQVTKL